jgi:hypothetical protein
MTPPTWPLVPARIERWVPDVCATGDRVRKGQRAAYLTAMQRADAGDCGALGELIARAMYDNLNRFIVPDVAGPAR